MLGPNQGGSISIPCPWHVVLMTMQLAQADVAVADSLRHTAYSSQEAPEQLSQHIMIKKMLKQADSQHTGSEKLCALRILGCRDALAST